MAWKAAYLCERCEREMSRNTMMYSNGVCPYCGNADNGTVVGCRTRAKRFIVTMRFPLWQFWKENEGYWEYKEE